MDLPKPIQPDELLAETGMVRRLAQALVRQHDLAADVVQDVMLAALRQPHAPQHLRGWLATLTRRLAMRSHRAQRDRVRHETERAAEPVGDPERRGIERLQVYRRLTDAVLALPEPYLTTVSLRFFEELPARAIAQRVGVSSEVVRKRLQRGLEMLRERLDADFGEREHWLRAFAVVGLLPVGSPWLLLTVLAMNKLALAAAATLAVGVYLAWPRADVPHVPTTSGVGGAAVKVRAEVDNERVTDAETRRVLASTPASGPPPECTVVVVDTHDRPIVDAVVYGWAAGSEQWSHRSTDARGRCSFGPVDGSGAVLVVADGHAPRHQTLMERRGEHRLVLPEGEVIEGSLTVDGQAGIGFRLMLEDVVPDAEIPGPLQVQLRFHHGAFATTGRSGAFRFEGLPSGWQGAIQLPRTLWFLASAPPNDDRRWRIAVRQPRLVLHTTQLPTVKGRVVWSDDGEPVAWPHVNGYAEFVDGQTSPLLGVAGHRDGWFALGFYGTSTSRAGEWRDPTRRPALQVVRLTVETEDGSAETSVELDADRLATGGDVVVRLERSPLTHFRCVDSEGEPIAGARVKARNLSEPTGADGRGTFAGTPAEVRLVGSPRHRIGPVEPQAPALGTAEDVLVFVLQPTNRVRLRVEGRVAGDPPCRLRSDVLMFAGGRDNDSLDEQLHGVELSATSRGRTQLDGSSLVYDHSLDLPLVERDAMTVCSLEPGTRCEFQLLDDLGRAWVSEAFRVPAFGEELEVVLRMPPRAAPFAGRVVDESGKPMARVLARFRTQHGDAELHRHRYTDAEGRFELKHPGDLAHTCLLLTHDGHAEQKHDALVAEGGLQTYTLQRGRELVAHVVDENGEPLDVTPVWRDVREEKREWVREGVYRWRDLPPGVVTLVCRIGADEFSVQHDTAVPTATLRVPRPATLRVHSSTDWPKPANALSAIFVRARCLAGGHQPHRIRVPQRGETEQLLPGTWHLELFESSRSDRSLPFVERSLGLSAEVTLRAGEETTAILR